MLGSASRPVRFHAVDNPLFASSVPSSFIKYIANDKAGRTEVVLMDGESMYILESQQDAHALWLAATEGK